MVNALHSRLEGFLAPFHGVATRRLQRYLDWFCYVEQFKHGDMDRRELLFEHEAEGTYWTTRRMTISRSEASWCTGPGSIRAMPMVV